MTGVRSIFLAGILALAGCAAQKAATNAAEAKNEAFQATKEVQAIKEDAVLATKLVDKTAGMFDMAQEAVEHPELEETLKETKNILGDIVLHSDKALEHHENINVAADNVIEALSGLTEKTSPWTWIILLGLVVLIMAGLLYFLERTGLLSLIGGFTHRDKQIATVLEKTQDPKDPMDINQAVAAIRGISPTISKAFEKKRAAKSPGVSK